MYVLIASIQFYIEGIRHLGDLTLSCFVFSPWPDLQAYQAGAKRNPPPTFRYRFICFCSGAQPAGWAVRHQQRLGYSPKGGMSTAEAQIEVKGVEAIF